jgi:3-hydroxyisobutyrate dehydrogenase-like beta-hydroxyacid dehydrogenase
MIGLLHPGQMGAAIGAQLVGAGQEVVWVRSGRSERSASRATEAGLRGVGSLAEMLDSCEVVLSICPPAAASEVAASVAGFSGVYVDCNAISPHRMIEISEHVATVVDGSIIGPPPGPERGARLYLSGPSAPVARVVSLFAGSRAEPIDLGERVGDASALKMAYGSYNKATHALAAVSFALAEEYGVSAALRVEAKRAGGALAEDHLLPVVAARAWRWGPEMLEAASSFAALGLPDHLAKGASAVFDRLSADKDNADLELSDVLRHLRHG